MSKYTRILWVYTEYMDNTHNNRVHYTMMQVENTC
jgi:hypothetical protein